jgi:hypothetical protein
MNGVLTGLCLLIAAYYGTRRAISHRAPNAKLANKFFIDLCKIFMSGKGGRRSTALIEQD